MASRTSCSLVTSQWTANASPPPAAADRASAAASSRASAVTSATPTHAPSAQNILAATRPIPLAPPVTKQTFPCNRTPLPSFQVSLPLPARDHAVVRLLLHPRRVHVVVHHVVAEDRSCEIASLEQLQRL